jgi:hypothetical protein
MARQDFLEGGYLGKLGDTVGSHYKNKHFSRLYVKGTNPNTPEQQAVRSKFALATKLAQEAMNINGRAPYWQSDTHTEFQLRVGTAQRRLLAGLPPEEAFPLYPDGYVGETTVTGVSADYVFDDDELIITSLSPVMSVERVFNVTYRYYVREGGTWAEDTTSVTIGAGETFTVTLDLNAHSSFPHGAYVEAATSDDGLHGDVAIELPRTALVQPRPPNAEASLDFTGVSFRSDLNKLILTAPYVGVTDDFPMTLSVLYYNGSSSAWDIQTPTVQVVAGMPQTVELPWNTTYQYPEGSKIASSHVRFDEPLYLDVFVYDIELVQP